MPKRKSDIMEIFSEYNPRMMQDGQIFTKCPFRENHEDGSGQKSFHISPDKNSFHCFSCGKGGKLTALLTTKFKVGFIDAVSMVGRMSDTAPIKKKEFDLDIMWSIEPPKDFLNRGFTRKTLKHFRLGVTDDGWIIIPFYKDFNDPTTLVGYQKRKNHPERIVINNTGFDKKSYLYNLDYSYNYTILVEGYSDAMRLHQFGYNSTALLGTELSDGQIKMLSEFETIYLALDNDDPGMMATEKCYKKLQKYVDNILLVPYCNKDPGECISPVKWGNYFAESTDYITYSRDMAKCCKNYIENKNKVLKQLK